MSRELKIVLGIIGGLIITCCLLLGIITLITPRMFENFAETAFTEDSGEAAAVAQSILTYDLPEHYVEEMAMDFAGMKMAAIAPNDGTSMWFMLMQFPAAMQTSEADMQRQMEDAFSQQTGQDDVQMDVVGTEDVVINEEAVTLTIMEGTQSGTEPGIRQVIGVFTANDGSPAMIMITGLLAEWDTNAYNQFFNSLATGR